MAVIFYSSGVCGSDVLWQWCFVAVMFCGSGVDDSGSCDIVALPLYWYGQLVGNQPLAVYLCVYV